LPGVPVDIKRAEMAWWLFGELCSTALARIATYTEVKEPNAPKQLIEWLPHAVPHWLTR